MPSVLITTKRFKKFKKASYMSDLKEAIEDAFYVSAKLAAASASKDVPVWTGMARAVYLGDVKTFEGAILPSSSIGLTDSPESVDITSNVRYNTKEFTGKGLSLRNRRYVPYYGKSREIRTILGGIRRSSYRFTKSKLSYKLFLATTVVHFLKFDKKWGSQREFKSEFKHALRAILAFTKPRLRDYR
jgi:hypothetical protein